MKGLTILEWKDEDRPREKFINCGAGALTDAELLAILLGSGNRNENVVDLARRILAEADNSLSVLRRYSIVELQKFKGIGRSKALTILALFELFRRIECEKTPVRTVIYSSKRPQMQNNLFYETNAMRSVGYSTLMWGTNLWQKSVLHRVEYRQP